MKSRADSGSTAGDIGLAGGADGAAGAVGGQGGFPVGGAGGSGGGDNSTDPNCYMRCGQGNAVYYGGAGGAGGVGAAGIGGGSAGSGGLFNSGGMAGGGGLLATGGSAGGGAGGASGAAGNDGSTADGNGLPACPGYPPTPAVDLCAQPVGGWPAVSSDGTRSAKLSGTVIAVAQGPITGGCLWVGSDLGLTVEALTVRVADDAGTADWDVEYAVPENGVTWLVGDHVDVSYSMSGGGWSPVVASLTLGHGQAVDVYVGRGGDVSQLSDVPLTFRQGAASCLVHDTCGDWSGYDLEVQTSAGWMVVPYGTARRIGAYRIFHGGVNHQLSSQSPCADWYIASARVAVFWVGS